MAYEPLYDPEQAVDSTITCLNDRALQGKNSYALSVSTNAASVTLTTGGIYMVFLDGLDPTKTLSLSVGASSSTPTAPTSGTPTNVVVFPCGAVERIRVPPSRLVVSAMLSAGTGTLYLVPLVTL